MSVNHSARSRGIIGISFLISSNLEVWRYNRDIFLISSNMEVCCVFSFESPRGGDSNEYILYTIFS